MTTAPSAAPKLRLDKWLWQARLFKTRTLAARTVGEGRVRVNGQRVTKPATAIGPGDVLTFSQGRSVRVIRVEALGHRRGPATEAQALYTDMAPPSDADTAPLEEPVPDPGGRPTKRQRRALDRIRGAALE